MRDDYIRWPDKTSAEELNYSIDWTPYLDGATIQSVAWSVPAGLTGGAQSIAGNVTTIILSGGTDGVDYAITCAIVLATSALDMQRVARLTVRNF
mgnify:CR=1 FL=1